MALTRALKRTLKQALPSWLIRAHQSGKVRRIRARNTGLSTQEVFTRIYRDRVWSPSSAGGFQSGSGSADAVADAYAAFVRTFIREKRIHSVVDLGCGDFNVGRRIAEPGVSYTGVDIVEEVVMANRRNYGTEDIGFRCLNIIDDDLPPADLCLVRQVFQHLSNDQIGSILPKLRQYTYVLISEHHPADAAAVPNLDKPHGEDIRLYDNSGVYLDAPPFSLPSVRVVHTMAAPPIVASGETITTMLIDNSGSDAATDAR